MVRIAWNKGKKGLQVAWNKGLKKETDARIKACSTKLIGRKISPELSKKLSLLRKGRKLSEITKKKLSIALKGRKLSEETKNKISLANLGKPSKLKAKKRPYLSNELNPNWKGENCSLSALHRWVERYKIKPIVCEICKESPPLDLANISQEYHRDINDFLWLCRKCHVRQDGRIEILLANASKHRNSMKGGKN